MDTDHAGLIDAKMELPPATPAAATVCRGRPLTGPDEGQTRAVEHEMEALAGRDQSQTALQMLTAPRERRIVGGGEVEAHHPEQGVQESFGLAQREMVEEPQSQGGLDGEIRVAPLPRPAGRSGGVSRQRSPPWTTTPSHRGVVARIVTGPHDAHRQDPHLPMRYDTGRPRAVIRLIRTFDRLGWDFHFRRPRMDPLHTRKPQRPRESFSSHNRPGSEAVTQPALTSWG